MSDNTEPRRVRFVDAEGRSPSPMPASPLSQSSPVAGQPPAIQTWGPGIWAAGWSQTPITPFIRPVSLPQTEIEQHVVRGASGGYSVSDHPYDPRDLPPAQSFISLGVHHSDAPAAICPGLTPHAHTSYAAPPPALPHYVAAGTLPGDAPQGSPALSAASALGARPPQMGGAMPSATPHSPINVALDGSLLVWNVRRDRFILLQRALGANVLQEPAFAKPTKTCVLKFYPPRFPGADEKGYMFEVTVERMTDAGHRDDLRVGDILAAIDSKLHEPRPAAYIPTVPSAFYNAAVGARNNRLGGQVSDAASWERVDIWPGASLYFRGLAPVSQTADGVQVYAVCLAGSPPFNVPQ